MIESIGITVLLHKPIIMNLQNLNEKQFPEYGEAYKENAPEVLIGGLFFK